MREYFISCIPVSWFILLDYYSISCYFVCIPYKREHTNDPTQTLDMFKLKDSYARRVTINLVIPNCWFKGYPWYIVYFLNYYIGFPLWIDTIPIVVCLWGFWCLKYRIESGFYTSNWVESLCTTKKRISTNHSSMIYYDMFVSW